MLVVVSGKVSYCQSFACRAGLNGKAKRKQRKKGEGKRKKKKKKMNWKTAPPQKVYIYVRVYAELDRNAERKTVNSQKINDKNTRAGLNKKKMSAKKEYAEKPTLVRQ